MTWADRRIRQVDADQENYTSRSCQDSIQFNRMVIDKATEH